jgi:GNAT superfamily N-acetyltransferase
MATPIEACTGMTVDERRHDLAGLDRNLATYVKLLAECAPGGGWEERDGLVLFAGAHAYPGTHTNGVIRLDPGLPADETLARASAFFKPRNRNYAVWIRDSADADLEAAVLAAGYEVRPPAQGLGVVRRWAPLDLDEHPVHPDAEMVAVADLETASAYVRLVGESFGMTGVPVEVLRRLFFDEQACLDPRVTVYVALIDGRPVSGCKVFVSDGVAGLYSGATIEAARGKGLARACLATCTNEGLGRGGSLAGGHSSEQGGPIWERMGFDMIAHYRRYIGRSA